MKNSKKKIMIILAIIIVLIIALAGATAAMIMTGHVAITSKQKLAKGLSDVGNMISISDLEENLKQYEKIKETPFEEETVISANVNDIELEDMSGAQMIVDEVKNTINNTKITNTVKADLKNNIINENLKLNLSNIIEEISADVDYNENVLSLRSKELNEKYINISKNDLESNYEYSDLIEIFDIIEEICKKSDVSIYFTEDEKMHFSETYGGIFLNSIKDNMITEESSIINVDDEQKECSKVTLTLNNKEIIELVEQYLNKLEEDQVGKEILINKIKLFENDFDENDLLYFIKNIRNEIIHLNGDAILKISVYCSMLKTYEMDIELIKLDDKISLIFGQNSQKLYIIENGEVLLNAVKTDELISISAKDDELSILLDMSEQEGVKVTSLLIEDLVDEISLEVLLKSEQVTKTDMEDVSKNTVEFSIKSDESTIDITFNIDSSMKFVDSIDTTPIDSNSISLVTATPEELQTYSEEVMNNAKVFVQKAAQNSKLVQMIYTLYANYLNSSMVTTGTQNEDVTTGMDNGSSTVEF